MLQITFGDNEKGILKAVLTEQKLRAAHNEGSGGLPEGNVEDVIRLNTAFDIGDINCSPIYDTRKRLITQMFYSDLWDEQTTLQDTTERYWDSCIADYNAFLQRAEAGEPVRIWYGNAPSSLCGYYGVLYELTNFSCTVTSIKLPEWFSTGNGLKQTSGWGDIHPENWLDYLPLEKELSKAELSASAEFWEKLRKENAPLRASINGHLFSVGSYFYDAFIRKEIDDHAIKVSQLILSILKKYPLGIGDWLIASRVKAMIRAGELQVVNRESRFYDSIIR